MTHCYGDFTYTPIILSFTIVYSLHYIKYINTPYTTLFIMINPIPVILNTPIRWSQLYVMEIPY